MIHSNEPKINGKVLQHHLPTSFDDRRVGTAVATVAAEVMTLMGVFFVVVDAMHLSFSS